MRPEFKKLIKWVLALLGALIVAFFLFIFIFPGERPRSPDSKRIANARMIASALEVYWDENKAYPNNLEQLVPKYMAIMPVYPNQKNKYCAPEQLKYKYTLLPNNEYKLEFCLDEGAGGSSQFKSGVNIINSESY